MKKNYFKSLLFAFVCGFYALGAIAAVSMFSDYGQIQNVQNYSSNPFWSPNSPYNQRLPQPVFATGADLNANDCIQVVQSLVSVQCMARDNCKNTDLSDIRPTVMVQLSNLPGANYVSSCSGYIDEIFESYKRQYGNTLPNRPTAFPNATTPNPDLNDTGGIKFENPYKQQPTKWQIEQKERADELQRLQAQNGVGSEHLVKTDFPATYADLSFSERLENDRAGLEPFKDLKAYKTLNVKNTAEWCADGEHENSTECWNWRCGENGRDAKNHKCVTYRCSKLDYYNAHTEECKRNKLCQNPTSASCMRYRCYETSDQDLDECKKWKCQNDSAYKTEHPEECPENKEESNPSSDSNQNNEEIDDGTVYYDLRVFSGKNITLNTEPSNLCYAVCGVHSAGDAVNEQVLYPILGARYCMPQNPTVTNNKSTYSIDEFLLKNIVLINTETNEPIKIPKSKYTEVINKLNSIKDSKGYCDGKLKKIYAVTAKHDMSSGTDKITVVDTILLDK